MRATKFEDPSAEPPHPAAIRSWMPSSAAETTSIGESGQWAMAHLVVTDMTQTDFTTSQQIWDAVSRGCRA